MLRYRGPMLLLPREGLAFGQADNAMTSHAAPLFACRYKGGGRSNRREALPLQTLLSRGMLAVRQCLGVLELDRAYTGRERTHAASWVSCADWPDSLASATQHEACAVTSGRACSCPDVLEAFCASSTRRGFGRGPNGGDSNSTVLYCTVLYSACMPGQACLDREIIECGRCRGCESWHCCCPCRSLR